MNDTIHPYYMDKARRVLIRAGGTAAAAGPLARWASDHADEHDTWLGVIVSERGDLIAETHQVRDRHPDDPGVYYVENLLRPDLQARLKGRECGLAVAELHSVIGPCIHVKWHEVGQGRPDTDTDGRVSAGDGR